MLDIENGKKMAEGFSDMTLRSIREAEKQEETVTPRSTHRGISLSSVKSGDICSQRPKQKEKKKYIGLD